MIISLPPPLGPALSNFTVSVAPTLTTQRHTVLSQEYEDRLADQSRNSREVNGLLQRKVREGSGGKLSAVWPCDRDGVNLLAPHLRHAVARPPPQGSWSESDVGSFARLCQEEHRVQGQVSEAYAAYEGAGDRLDSARTALTAAIRERYSQEQAWGDKIRRASTWWVEMCGQTCVDVLINFD